MNQKDCVEVIVNFKFWAPTMTSGSQYLHALDVSQNRDGTYQGSVVIRLNNEVVEGSTRYGWKLDVCGTFKSRDEVSREGDKLFSRFLKGEVTTQSFSAKEKIRGYRVVGKAKFDVGNRKWEPTLELKKTEDPGKGKTQTVRDRAFMNNQFPKEEQAAKFALEYGKRMVLKLVNGLEI